ncbi:MAG: hypothetical protein IRY90_09020 [Actinomadura rubrobrunea]|nr:hypothetical protein [Actinomadura rubrobrunea]
MSFGTAVLHEHLTRNLGAPPFSLEGYPRMALAMFDILTDNLMSPELKAQARVAIEQLKASAPEGAQPDRQRIPTSDAAARKGDSDPPA